MSEVLGNAALQATNALAGSGVASGLLSVFGAKKRQKLADKQNRRFWEMQNAYNHPSQQMARLREAGLNPNLVYGDGIKGATGQAEAIAPSKAAPFDFQINPGKPLQSLLTYADIKKRQAETDNLAEHNKVLMEQVGLLRAQTLKTFTDNLNSKLKYKLDTATFQDQIDAVRESLNNLRLTGANTAANTANIEAGTALRAQELDQKRQLFPQELEKLKQEVEIAKATLTGKDLENAIKEFAVNLQKYGLTPSDPLFYRVMQAGNEFLSEKEKQTLKKLKAMTGATVAGKVAAAGASLGFLRKLPKIFKR